MNAEEITKYVKSGAIILSAFGVALDPEQIKAIGVVAGLIYGIISAFEGWKFKRRQK